MLSEGLPDNLLIEKLWKDVVDKYSSSSRDNHTLNHLEHLYRELQNIQHKIENWNVIVLAKPITISFTMFRKNENEECRVPHHIKI